jgi:hypothetical protein
MPDGDFRLLIGAFRDHNRALIGTEPPRLTPAPALKQCRGKCKEWRPLAQFSKGASDKISEKDLQEKARQ